MSYSLLPLFLATSLGASALTISLIERLAESMALIVKVFSGVVSGAPFWFTPEGRFEAAEQSNGLFVERVMLRTEHGLCVIGPRQDRSIGRGTQWREAG